MLFHHRYFPNITLYDQTSQRAGSQFRFTYSLTQAKHFTQTKLNRKHSMNTSNAIELLMAVGLTTFVVAGLVTAGMTTAIVTGAVIGSAYLLTK